MREALGEIGVEGFLGAAHRKMGVVDARDADEDAGGAAAQPVRRLAGLLQRFPGHLEQQPLLGVHRDRLARRDPEEVGVELVDAVDEAAPAGRHLAGRREIGVVVGVDVPAVGRDLADRVDAALQQPPEALGIVRAAGEAAADADDRDRVAMRALGRLEPHPHVAQLGERALDGRHLCRDRLVGRGLWGGLLLHPHATLCPDIRLAHLGELGLEHGFGLGVAHLLERILGRRVGAVAIAACRGGLARVEEFIGYKPYDRVDGRVIERERSG